MLARTHTHTQSNWLLFPGVKKHRWHLQTANRTITVIQDKCCLSLPDFDICGDDCSFHQTSDITAAAARRGHALGLLSFSRVSFSHLLNLHFLLHLVLVFFDYKFFLLFWRLSSCFCTFACAVVFSSLCPFPHLFPLLFPFLLPLHPFWLIFSHFKLNKQSRLHPMLRFIPSSAVTFFFLASAGFAVRSLRGRCLSNLCKRGLNVLWCCAGRMSMFSKNPIRIKWRLGDRNRNNSEDQRATEESTAERRCYMLGKKANKQAGASQQVAAGVCCDTDVCFSDTWRRAAGFM